MMGIVTAMAITASRDKPPTRGLDSFGGLLAGGVPAPVVVDVEPAEDGPVVVAWLPPDMTMMPRLTMANSGEEPVVVSGKDVGMTVGQSDGALQNVATPLVKGFLAQSHPVLHVKPLKWRNLVIYCAYAAPREYGLGDSSTHVGQHTNKFEGVPWALHAEE